MAPHSSTLAWKIPWAAEPGRLQSMALLRVRHSWVTSLSLFTFMPWRRKWQPTSVLLPGESQGWGSLVGFRLWDRTESDMTEVTYQQQQHTAQRRGLGPQRHRLDPQRLRTWSIEMWAWSTEMQAWSTEIEDLVHKDVGMVHRDAGLAHRNEDFIHRDAGLVHWDGGLVHRDAGLAHRNEDFVHRYGGLVHRDAGLAHRNEDFIQRDVDLVHWDANSVHRDDSGPQTCWVGPQRCQLGPHSCTALVRKNHPVCNGEGWDGVDDRREVQEGEDICIPMADSCRCMAETTTILLRQLSCN